MSRARIGLAIVAVACGWLASAVPAQELPPRCSGLLRGGRRGHFMARADLLAPDGLVDGDDLLALVNRSPQGALPSDYAPRDLVDLETLRPARVHQCVPPRKQCLREEAAHAWRALEAAMRADGLRPYLYSAFRAYPVQCATFLGWAERERGGFCEAVTASALPGHSQHQLGTTLDVFTRDWLDGGDRFREGFGCTPGGRWLEAHAHQHGFVLPYPLHADYRREGSDCRGRERGAEARIDPRTGYRYEPWHLRYVGREHAARFRSAWLASGPGTPGALTLDQWLSAEQGEPEPIRAPVCDGCNCDRCATFAQGDSSGGSSGDSSGGSARNAGRMPCDRPPLRLDARGRPLPAEAPPSILSAEIHREGERAVLHVRVMVPDNTLTQPPVVTPRSGAIFARGERDPRLPDRAARSFEAIEGAWRLAIGFGSAHDYWPWRAALASSRLDGTANGHNARMPAPPGELALTIPMDAVLPGTQVRVGLASGGTVRDVVSLRAPELAP